MKTDHDHILSHKRHVLGLPNFPDGTVSAPNAYYDELLFEFPRFLVTRPRDQKIVCMILIAQASPSGFAYSACAHLFGESATGAEGQDFFCYWHFRLQLKIRLVFSFPSTEHIWFLGQKNESTISAIQHMFVSTIGNAEGHY